MRRAVYEFPAHITVEEATRAYMEAACRQNAAMPFSNA